jgi:phosphomannomutase
VTDHSAAAREHRAEAVELLRLAGCDDLAERIAEHLEAAAVHAVLHRLEVAVDAAHGPAAALLKRVCAGGGT